LDQLDVRLHPVLGEVGRKEVVDVGVAVQPSKLSFTSALTRFAKSRRIAY
jgi:hypothetical protein